ncbi:WD40 repeat-containing protein [Tieghemostelium lacteum]|uniref:WD40 repeat-containing protein n=1 Tax=Tieghemostelium lacteum TaxID=361077 RepID=A0A152A315_TIELA|nr:WD40 repeat-containing protein [Tieghemostelium lacteum]|eukprot:KYR00495.1 WD40 repeat-containing protein [Tieghemostelium lacteum]
MSSSDGTSGIDDDDDEYFYDIEQKDEYDNEDVEDDGVDDGFSDNLTTSNPNNNDNNSSVRRNNNINNNNNNNGYIYQYFNSNNNDNNEEDYFDEDEEEEYEDEEEVYDDDEEMINLEDGVLSELLRQSGMGAIGTFSQVLNSYYMNYLTNNYQTPNNDSNSNSNSNNNNGEKKKKEEEQDEEIMKPVDINNEKIKIEYLNRVRNENTTLQEYLLKREIYGNWNNKNIRISNHYLPNSIPVDINQTGFKIFCCKLSQDGQSFMTASQDRMIRFYNTTTWKETSYIQARDINWSIIDTDYSSDQSHLIYSSWSPFIQLCKIRDGVSNSANEEPSDHIPLDLDTNSDRCCVFSLKFSPNNHEILAGSLDGYIYLYDLVEKRKILEFRGHGDDVNSVCYLDQSGNIFATGSDDCFIKLWDRRTLNQKSDSEKVSSLGRGKPHKPIGVMAGHHHGLTHVTPKGDGVYLLSNSKDHSAKLWDTRKMSNMSVLNNSSDLQQRHTIGRFFWDYRIRPHIDLPTVPKNKNDSSLMTYQGHSVEQTLIRCYFSPTETTAQKYIYTGSFQGNIYIYETLTGKLVQILKDQRGTIRDLAWSPHSMEIISTNWAGCIVKWDDFSDTRDTINFKHSIK